MSGQYTITFTDPAKGSFVINSLETEGPGSLNIVPIVSANSASSVFAVSGDFTPRFVAGFDFGVVNSVVAPPTNNSFVYTVIAVTPGLGGTWKISGTHASEFAVGETFSITGNTGTNYAIAGVVSGIHGTFSIVGNQTATFTPGFEFPVNGSTGNNGTYTVFGSSFVLGNTIIEVTGTIPSPIVDGQINVSGNGLYTVVSATNNAGNTDIVVSETILTQATADGSMVANYQVVSSIFQGTSAINTISAVQKKFVLNGFNYTTIFTPNRIFKIANSTAPVSNDGYWITLSSAFVAGNTEITVQTGTPPGFRDGNTIDGSEGVPTGSIITNLTAIVVTPNIPITTTIPDGQINYTLPGHTSLTLPGRGSVNYGQNIIEDLVHMLENWCFPLQPANPTTGQLWYNNVLSVLSVWDEPSASWIPLNTGPVASNVRLNGILSALADNTINNTIYEQAWEWTLTGNTTAMLIGESAPSVLGTGSQYLLDVETLATSTADPFRVAVGGVENFKISNAAEWIVGGTAGAAGQVLTSAGPGLPPAWAPTGSGTVPLSSITAAAADNTIANSNFQQTWNWILTSDIQTAFRFGENGPSTGGIGAQTLVRVATETGSTARPFVVTTQGFTIIDTLASGELQLSCAPSTGMAITGGVTPVGVVFGNNINIQGGPGGSVAGGGGTVILQGGTATDGGGGPVQLTGADGTGNNRSGGFINLQAGTSSATGNAAAGGNLIFTAGAGLDDNNGGNVSVTAGPVAGVGAAGTVTITSGNSATNGAGGLLSLLGGTGGTVAGSGGTISIQGGLGIVQSGGTVAITGGTGVPGGSVNITGGTSTTIGAQGGNVSIFGGTPTDGNGGTISLAASDGVGTNRTGGAVAIQSGNSTGTADGANVTITAGTSGNSGIRNGGMVTILGGAGAGPIGFGGQITIQGGTGSATQGDGGSIFILAGTSPTVGAGGNINITASDGAAVGNPGGHISLTGGSVTAGSTVAGNIDMTAGSSSSATSAPGNITQTTSAGHIATQGGNFATAGDAQSNEYQVRTETTNATLTELFLDGTAGTRRMTLSPNSAWRFEIHLTAYETVGANVGWVAAYEIKGAIKNIAGTTSIVGSVSQNITADDSSGVWTVTVDADNGNDSLRVQVTGEAATTIRWLAFVRSVEVKA